MKMQRIILGIIFYSVSIFADISLLFSARNDVEKKIMQEYLQRLKKASNVITIMGKDKGGDLKGILGAKEYGEIDINKTIPLKIHSVYGPIEWIKIENIYIQSKQDKDQRKFLPGVRFRVHDSNEYIVRFAPCPDHENNAEILNVRQGQSIFCVAEIKDERKKSLLKVKGKK